MHIMPHSLAPCVDLVHTFLRHLKNCVLVLPHVSCLNRVLDPFISYILPSMGHSGTVLAGPSLQLLQTLSPPLMQVSGTKFYYLRNEGVLLEMALINWALAKLIQRGFVPVTTPDLVRSHVVEKCGFQPRANNTQAGAFFFTLHHLVEASLAARQCC